MFNLAIDSTLRPCDLMRLQVQDIRHGSDVARRATVMATEDAASGPIRDHGANPKEPLLTSKISLELRYFHI